MGRALEMIEKKLLMTIVYFQLKFFQPIPKTPAYSDKTTNYAIEFTKVISTLYELAVRLVTLGHRLHKVK